MSGTVLQIPYEECIYYGKLDDLLSVHNGFFQIAIYGKNFFSSAKDSFLLITRNIVRTVVVHKVAGILLFLGKAMITLGMGKHFKLFFDTIDKIGGVQICFPLNKNDLFQVSSVSTTFLVDGSLKVFQKSNSTTTLCQLSLLSLVRP